MKLTLGASAQTARTYRPGDAATFAALAGAAQTPAHVPEPLIAALFSYLLGVKLPGAGTNYLKQELRFPAPAPFGEELTARVTVTRLRPDKKLVDLETVCVTGDGTRVCEGRALVLAADVADAGWDS